MKKILTGLILAAVLGAVLAPVVSATPPTTLPNGCTLRKTIGTGDCGGFVAGNFCNPDGVSGVNSGKPCPGVCCLLNTIFTVTDWLFYILTLIVVLMVIYGGFVILTASGDPEKAGKGRSILTYAIIGLAVALLARIIPSVVQFIMGV